MKFTNEDPPHVLVEEIIRLRHKLAIAKADVRAVERLYNRQGEIYNTLLTAHQALLHSQYHAARKTKWLARFRAWLNK